jgi:hypothetical protein
VNDHKKAEQAHRDRMVSEYLNNVGATKCPTKAPTSQPEARTLSPEERVMRSQYYATRTERELTMMDYAPCNDNGVDSSYLKTNPEDAEDAS